MKALVTCSSAMPAFSGKARQPDRPLLVHAGHGPAPLAGSLIKYRWGAARWCGARGSGWGGARAGRLIPPRAAPRDIRASAGHGRENRWDVRLLWWQLLVPPVEPGQRLGRLPMWVGTVTAIPRRRSARNVRHQKVRLYLVRRGVTRVIKLITVCVGPQL